MYSFHDDVDDILHWLVTIATILQRSHNEMHARNLSAFGRSACLSQLAMLSIKLLQIPRLVHPPSSGALAYCYRFLFFFANGQTIEFMPSMLLSLIASEATKIRIFEGSAVLQTFRGVLKPPNEPSK